MVRRLLTAAVLSFAVFSGIAEAQTDVALRFYIVPKIGTGVFPTDPYRAKYIADLGVAYAAMDYGLDNTFLVGAQVTSAQNTDLAANLDVIAIPQNLDNTIGLTALSTVQAKLEGLHIPADWVTTNHTYRDVIRITGKLFLYMQRFSGQQLHTFFESGITLDTRINELTQAQRNAMNQAALSMGLDTSSITGPMLLRQAFKILADQIPSFRLAGEVF